MTVKLEKTEYNFLMEFYLNTTTFDPMTSTFTYLEARERKELLLTIGVLQRKLEEIMPKVQDRESNATNKTIKESRSDYNSKQIVGNIGNLSE